MPAAYVEWGGVKINLVDTPGFHMFLYETRAAMLPVGGCAGGGERADWSGGGDRPGCG